MGSLFNKRTRVSEVVCKTNSIISQGRTSPFLRGRRGKGGGGRGEGEEGEGRGRGEREGGGGRRWAVSNLVPRAHVPFGQHQDTELWNNQFPETKILGLPASQRMRGLVYMASRDKVDVDTFHKGIQYALERLGKSKFGHESTTVSNFKSKSHEGSGNELVDYSRAPCLGADQKARGLWERDWAVSWGMNVFLIFRLYVIFLVRNSLCENSF